MSGAGSESDSSDDSGSGDGFFQFADHTFRGSHRGSAGDAAVLSLVASTTPTRTICLPRITKGTANARLMKEIKRMRWIRETIIYCRVCVGYVTWTKCVASRALSRVFKRKKQKSRTNESGLRIRYNYELKRRKGHTHYPVPSNVTVKLATEPKKTFGVYILISAV